MGFSKIHQSKVRPTLEHNVKTISIDLYAYLLVVSSSLPLSLLAILMYTTDVRTPLFRPAT